MKINLKNYLEERERLMAHQSETGPFITLSRSYGCDEESVIKSLIQKLNKLGSGGFKSHPWRYIDKEILEESAHELGMTSLDVDHRIQLHHADVVNDLLSVFNHHYHLPDKKIIDKVKDIICTYAKKGNVIIVGRGGIGVTRKLPNSLHIKLNAPLEHRIQVVSEVKKISATEAEKLIHKTDHSRKLWAEHLIDKAIDTSIFDLIFNMESTSVDEITDMIIAVLQKRALVPAELVTQEHH
ncbi:AAA family ATPase [Marinoscillum sp.]|uniref:cytidylate kinase-like family protein n=1 Tax=Marinoscillum sp. TaxID=2024838 RepID=UPI003BA8AA3E